MAWNKERRGGVNWSNKMFTYKRIRSLVLITGMLFFYFFKIANAMREVPTGAPTDLSERITVEKKYQQSIVQKEKFRQQTGGQKISTPLPIAAPMPSRQKDFSNKNSSFSPGYTPSVSYNDKLTEPVSRTQERQSPAYQKRAETIKKKQSNGWMDWLTVLLILVVVISLFFILKMGWRKNERGQSLIIFVAILFIVFIIGVLLVWLTQNETKRYIKSSKDNSVLYIADAGVEKTLWELQQNPSYAGEADTALGTGTFSVAVSTPPGFSNRREVISTGYIPKSSDFIAKRAIKAICEKPDNTISVTSALSCGGNVNVGGNAAVSGDTIAGITVPIGATVTTSGGGSVTGNPPTGTGPYPSFEDIFTLTEEQIESIATTKYTNPPNDANCTGITWIDGNFKAASNGWYGWGILIINGDFEINGGAFEGVIYVTGTFKMAGNATIRGGIFAQAMADVAGITGTASIMYDYNQIQKAENTYPYQIISWQEIKN